MTKYSEDFKKEVREYYAKGKLIKKYNHDKSFTFVDVAKKFNLTVEQVRTVLYNKKSLNSTKYWSDKEGIHKHSNKHSKHRPVASEWRKPRWSKSKDDFKGKFVDDPRAEEYDKYGSLYK